MLAVPCEISGPQGNMMKCVAAIPSLPRLHCNKLKSTTAMIPGNIQKHAKTNHIDIERYRETYTIQKHVKHRNMHSGTGQFAMLLISSHRGTLRPKQARTPEPLQVFSRLVSLALQVSQRVYMIYVCLFWSIII